MTRKICWQFEKEVLGFYISGHPLEEYEEQWKNGISHVTTDFLPVEEGELPKVHDGERAIVGGMITAKTMKATKTNKMMAFLNVEDLVRKCGSHRISEGL